MLLLAGCGDSSPVASHARPSASGVPADWLAVHAATNSLFGPAASDEITNLPPTDKLFSSEWQPPEEYSAPLQSSPLLDRALSR